MTDTNHYPCVWLVLGNTLVYDWFLTMCFQCFQALKGYQRPTVSLWTPPPWPSTVPPSACWGRTRTVKANDTIENILRPAEFSGTELFLWMDGFCYVSQFNIVSVSCFSFIWNHCTHGLTHCHLLHGNVCELNSDILVIKLNFCPYLFS